MVPAVAEAEAEVWLPREQRVLPLLLWRRKRRRKVVEGENFAPRPPPSHLGADDVAGKETYVLGCKTNDRDLQKKDQ
jgi:hypothetical protein